MRELELLAPARNADIGIAAIDCGADAVYIAGPKFGARQAAGNGIADIERLCSYAHRFGARIFVTLNTIIYEDELEQARRMLEQVVQAGADAVIVQDLAMIPLAVGLGVPLHASTQCAVRTPEKARWLESLGFSRLILERELPVGTVRRIASAVSCEVECFVHGALCVCYSGQCYLSEHIAGRSANRGACIQACRSRYDLADASGRILVRDKALLSLKDLNLLGRIPELASAGVTSFKIEGRLKNESYVRNIVSAYSDALDRFIAGDAEGKWRRASFGSVTGNFTPSVEKTFNRGYTELFFDARRSQWSSMDAAKSMGEEIGTVTSLSRKKDSFRVRPAEGREGLVLSNGDGLSFVSRGGDVLGVRADVCHGEEVRCKPTLELFEGARLYRNYDRAFEKALESRPSVRLLSVDVSVEISGDVLRVRAVTEDGREAVREVPAGEPAQNGERMKGLFIAQLSKVSGIYSFRCSSISDNGLPFLQVSAINEIRRSLVADLDGMPFRALEMYAAPLKSLEDLSNLKKGPLSDAREPLRSSSDYRDNISNSLARQVYAAVGVTPGEQAYELTHRKGAELMRSKYCVRHELGLCPRQASDMVSPGRKAAEDLYLLNNGRRLTLHFDCASCEMTVTGD
ncbi:MAG: U32 family peptidase [Candidatus Cryptobacteroides sp.]